MPLLSDDLQISSFVASYTGKPNLFIPMHIKKKKKTASHRAELRDQTRYHNLKTKNEVTYLHLFSN